MYTRSWQYSTIPHKRNLLNRWYQIKESVTNRRTLQRTGGYQRSEEGRDKYRVQHYIIHVTEKLNQVEVQATIRQNHADSVIKYAKTRNITIQQTTVNVSSVDRNVEIYHIVACAKRTKSSVEHASRKDKKYQS